MFLSNFVIHFFLIIYLNMKIMHTISNNDGTNKYLKLAGLAEMKCKELIVKVKNSVCLKF